MYYCYVLFLTIDIKNCFCNSKTHPCHAMNIGITYPKESAKLVAPLLMMPVFIHMTNILVFKTFDSK